MSTGGFSAGMMGGKAKLRLWERDGGTCHICGEKVNDIRDATRDHLVPRSLGGCTCAANLALAHRRCNNSRGSRPRGSTPGGGWLGTKSQRRRKGHTLAEHGRR